MNQPLDHSLASSFLVAQLEQAVQRVLARRLSELRTAATNRTSVENLWLQRDLEQELHNRPDINVTTQTPIAANGKVKIVDLVLSAGQTRLLVELKAFLTNYGLPGKNVTQSRDAIRSDLRALVERLDEHTDGCVVWLAYPIPDQRQGDWRVNHLSAIERDSATRRVAKVNVGQAYVHVYISASRPEAAQIAS